MNQLNSTMSSMSDIHLAATINNVILQLNRYPTIFIFIFGSIGNILNILILSESSFRKNSCSILFLFSSVTSFVAILSGLTSRMLSGWGADLTATNRPICKLRAFLVNIAKSEAVLCILFAMINRWLLSSSKAHYRQMNSLKNTYRAMLISFIVVIMAFSHIIYCQEPNRINSPQKCYGVTIACQYATDLLFMVFVMFPLPFMLIFGLMTIYNIRQSRNRITPGNASIITNTMAINSVTSKVVTNNRNQQQRLSKQDNHLLLMLLAQITILFVLSIPLAFQRLYATIVADRPASASQIAINNLVFNIGQLLHFTANGIPFYIYTLTGGSTFRKGLLNFFVNRRH